jgi:uncharacterized protein (TIGR02265 family)
VYSRGVFVEPDWKAQVDFEARLAAVPAEATVRGMFLQLLQESLPGDAASAARARRYLSFKNYPMRDYVELLALGCTKLARGLGQGECVRRLGRTVYPRYADTITGTAIFAVAGRDFRRVLELCPAAYRVSTPTAEVSILNVEDGRARVALRGMWNLPDLHQIGIFEGAMDVCGVIGKITVERYSLCDVDFEVRWRAANI